MDRRPEEEEEEEDLGDVVTIRETCRKLYKHIGGGSGSAPVRTDSSLTGKPSTEHDSGKMKGAMHSTTCRFPRYAFVV